MSKREKYNREQRRKRRAKKRQSLRMKLAVAGLSLSSLLATDNLNASPIAKDLISRAYRRYHSQQTVPLVEEGNSRSLPKALVLEPSTDDGIILAGHRSHSSHSSHSSHRSGSTGHASHSSHVSHRSASGTTYTPPARTPVQPTRTSSPKTADTTSDDLPKTDDPEVLGRKLVEMKDGSLILGKVTRMEEVYSIKTDYGTLYVNERAVKEFSTPPKKKSVKESPDYRVVLKNGREVVGPMRYENEQYIVDMGEMELKFPKDQVKSIDKVVTPTSQPALTQLPTRQSKPVPDELFDSPPTDRQKIYLKDGSTVYGLIKKVPDYRDKTKFKYVIKTKYGSFNIEKSDVTKMESVKSIEARERRRSLLKRVGDTSNNPEVKQKIERRLNANSR